MAPKKVKAGAAAATEPEVAPPPAEEQNYTIIPGNDWEPPKMMIRPSDQLQLTDKELGEEVTQLWKAENPNAAHNITYFSHKEKSFKHVATVEQSEFHLMQVRHAPNPGAPLLCNARVPVRSRQGRTAARHTLSGARVALVCGWPGGGCAPDGPHCGRRCERARVNPTYALSQQRRRPYRRHSSLACASPPLLNSSRALP